MPAPERFWTGRMGTFYLTDEGTSTGDPWKLDVTGFAPFFDPDVAVNSTPAADGSPIQQAVAIDSAGIPFQLELPQFDANQLPTLLAILRPTRGQAGTPVRVRLNCPALAIDVMAKASGGDFIEFKGFSINIIDNVVIKFESTGPGA